MNRVELDIYLKVKLKLSACNYENGLPCLKKKVLRAFEKSSHKLWVTFRSIQYVALATENTKTPEGLTSVLVQKDFLNNFLVVQFYQ